VKKKLLSMILAATLVLTVGIPAHAADGVDGEIFLTPGTETTSLVQVKAYGLPANGFVSLIGYYDDEIDYINQYTADSDGNIDITYPSSKDWEGGKVIKVKVQGSDFELEFAAATGIKLTGVGSVVRVSAGQKKELNAGVPDTPNTNYGLVWTSSNPAIAKITPKADTDGSVTVAALKKGVAIITVTAYDGSSINWTFTVI
jgi:uncharacterized protein YjdB